MTRPLVADYVSIDEDDDVLVVELADQAFNASRRLVLQRPSAPSTLDVELGIDGYSVEVDDQTQSCHGGIESFELFPDHLCVTFDDDAVDTLGGEKTIRVEFDLRERQLEQLRGCLARIFAGSACYLDLCG